MALFTRTILFSILLMPFVSFTTQTERTPLENCTADIVASLREAVPDYTAGEMPFVSLDGNRFIANGEPFVLRGVNYYPANYPWRRFLTETDVNTLRDEMALIRETGFNSLRIFLWNEALFECEANGVVPTPDAFSRLDMIIQTAAEHNLYLIVTLNDLPDLTNFPLYENPPHIIAQTEYIVTRYRDEGTILAWDLRNEGDIDYDGINFFKPGTVAQDVVIDWLAQTSEQVRSIDENHLITAGWRYNEQHTLPYVDFVSFHHWRGAGELRTRLENMNYDKPVLLQEFGYTTFDLSEERQAEAIRDVMRLVEEERGDVLGWMVWAAFDFPLTATCYPGDCVSVDNREHHFGIWYSDYSEKPAVRFIMREISRLDG